MRIVFNLRDQDWETTKSLGILNVSTRILRGLVELGEIERIDVLANHSLASKLSFLETSPVCRLHYATSPAPRGWARLWWDQVSLVQVCDRLAPDWLLLPKGFSPLVRWPRAKVSAFVHDNILEYYRRRGHSPFPLGQSTLFRFSLRRSVRNASSIVTNSNFTLNEVMRDLAPVCHVARIGVPTAPIASTPNPASLSSEGRLLLPTSVWPHKLTTRAIEWLHRWEDLTGNCRSIDGFGSLPAGCMWPDRPHWTHHGRIGDAALGNLLSGAAALIYFSAYEGYGMPPVEAAAQGVRGIASDLPPLRETMPSQALFDNSRYETFHETLTRVLATPPMAPLIVESEREVAGRWLAALRDRVPARPPL